MKNLYRQKHWTATPTPDVGHRSLDSIATLISSEPYRELLDQVVNLTGIEVQEAVSARMLEFDKIRLTNAELTIGDLKHEAEGGLEEISRFVFSKMQKYALVPFASPSNSEHAHSGEIGKTVADSPFLKNFLMIYLIEYVLLLRHPDLLEDYLKKARVPNAKRYARELKTIFELIHTKQTL